MARAILIEVTLRFQGYNNGAIAISYKELAFRLGRKNEAPFAAAVAQLISHGFLEVMLEGEQKERRALEYRLTFVSTTGQHGGAVPATNEYLHWKPGDKSSTANAVAAQEQSATASEAERVSAATNAIAEGTEIRGVNGGRLLRRR